MKKGVGSKKKFFYRYVIYERPLKKNSDLEGIHIRHSFYCKQILDS